MSLLDQVYDVSPKRETKAEVIEGYREKYPGRGQQGWKQHIVHDLAEITGLKSKNLEKRFDTQRRESPEPRNRAQYRELGEKLLPMVPEGGYYIHGVIYVKYSKDCVDRDIDIVIEGDAAKELLKMSADAMLQATANAYQSQEGDITFKGPSIGDCNEPDLTVEALP